MIKGICKNIFFLLIFILAVAANHTQAQTDSVIFTNDIVLKEGIYLSYNDFRKNNPIPKEAIESKEDKTLLDFISKTLNDFKEITVAFSGQNNKIPVKNIWGFCQNNTLYLNYESKFYRVPVFGNISHFLATAEVYNYNNNYGVGMGYGGMMGGGMVGGGSVPIKTKEIKQFIFDFYTGDIIDYNMHKVEILMSRDLKLYQEFMQIKKRKRKEMLMLYIRKYNAVHPISFPVVK